jgi:peptide/nickel transport system permease protein
VTLLELDLAPEAEPRGTWRRLRADRTALAGLVIVTVLALVAIAAPLLAALEGQDPNTFHSALLDSAKGGVPRGAFGGVSARHWLGVEPGTGRDVFARAVHGARVSLFIALTATAGQVLLGILIGMAAGLGGAWADAVLGRAIDLSIAFPELLLALALMAVVPDSVPRPLILMLVIALVGWGATARMVRGQTLSLKTRDFVAAARLGGAGRARIAGREILPGLTSPLLVVAAFKIPTNMVSEAGLSFLGAGVRPPTSSWGQMLSSASTWFRSDPVYVLVPATLLVVSLLAFMLLAEGVRTAIDPRNARRPA